MGLVVVIIIDNCISYTDLFSSHGIWHIGAFR